MANLRDAINPLPGVFGFLQLVDGATYAESDNRLNGMGQLQV